MPPFSFVHAADFHLDSPFIGIGKLPEEQRHIVQSLREATFEAFQAVVDLCIAREADFLLVAGDVYDGADRSLRAQLRFRDGLKRLAERGIRTYVVHGNHDPLDGWSHALQFPETVHVFKHQLESVVFEKEGISGRQDSRHQLPQPGNPQRFRQGNEARGGRAVPDWPVPL